MFAQGLSLCDEALKTLSDPSHDQDVSQRLFGEGLHMMQHGVVHSNVTAWDDLEVLLRYKKMYNKVKSDPQATQQQDICPVPIPATKLQLEDVAGGELMEQAKNVIRQHTILPLTFTRLFQGTQSGNILLYGVPGTGKTTLAEAASNSSGGAVRYLGSCGEVPALPLFSVSVTDIKGKYVGESEKNLKRYMRAAAAAAPSIIFFDEADALFNPEDKFNSGIINTFKQEVGGLGTKDMSVVVMFATNHPKRIDGAILSRLGASVEIPLPNYEARKLICEKTLRSLVGNPPSNAHSIEQMAKHIAEQTSPPMYLSNLSLEHQKKLYSGRDIQAICQQVHLHSLSRQTGMQYVVRQNDGTYVFNDTNDSRNVPINQIDDGIRRSVVARPIEMQDIEHVMGVYQPTVTVTDLEEQIDYNTHLGKTFILRNKEDVETYLSKKYPPGVDVDDELMRDVRRYFGIPLGENTTVPEN